ncbi:hypothetical protein B0H11DRAFT_1303462 [Mycena galericulata]|nr:hypothetical protein B0H11DRAFT_1303462 [Mycena galericulata]
MLNSVLLLTLQAVFGTLLSEFVLQPVINSGVHFINTACKKYLIPPANQISYFSFLEPRDTHSLSIPSSPSDLLRQSETPLLTASTTSVEYVWVIFTPTPTISRQGSTLPPPPTHTSPPFSTLNAAADTAAPKSVNVDPSGSSAEYHIMLTVTAVTGILFYWSLIKAALRSLYYTLFRGAVAAPPIPTVPAVVPRPEEHVRPMAERPRRLVRSASCPVFSSGAFRSFDELDGGLIEGDSMSSVHSGISEEGSASSGSISSTSSTSSGVNDTFANVRGGHGGLRPRDFVAGPATPSAVSLRAPPQTLASPQRTRPATAHTISPPPITSTPLTLTASSSTESEGTVNDTFAHIHGEGRPVPGWPSVRSRRRSSPQQAVAGPSRRMDRGGRPAGTSQGRQPKEAARTGVPSTIPQTPVGERQDPRVAQQVQRYGRPGAALPA